MVKKLSFVLVAQREVPVAAQSNAPLNRIPLEQGEQWYVALKRLGVTAEMLLFHGENHELSRSGKPANRLVRLDGILEWFQRFLT